MLSLSLSLSPSLTPADRERSRHRQQQQSAAGAGERVGGDPGVGLQAEGGVRLGLHGGQEPGQQLLPGLRGAGALQHPRVPADVSSLFEALTAVTESIFCTPVE